MDEVKPDISALRLLDSELCQFRLGHWEHGNRGLHRPKRMTVLEIVIPSIRLRWKQKLHVGMLICTPQ